MTKPNNLISNVMNKDSKPNKQHSHPLEDEARETCKVHIKNVQSVYMSEPKNQITDNLMEEFIKQYVSSIFDSSNHNGDKLYGWITKNYIPREKHIDQMRELAESFRMKEREGFDTDKMYCDICGDYDDCDCSGYNEAVDKINTKVDTIKEKLK